MRFTVALLALVTLAAPVGAGEQGVGAEGRAKAVAPFVDQLAFAVGRIDLTRPDADEVVFLLGSTAPQVLGLLGDLGRKDLQSLLGSARTLGAKELYVVYNLADLGRQPLYVVLPAGGANGKKL